MNVDYMNDTYEYSYSDYEPRTTYNLTGIVMLIVISIIAIISLVCNGLILAVVIKRPLLHNFHYIALSCVAVVDILDPLLGIASVFVLDWFFYVGTIGCKVLLTLPYVTSLVIPLCVSAIALVRWRAKERFQFGEEKDVRSSVLVMVLIWVVSAAASSPVFYFAKSQYIERKGSIECDLHLSYHIIQTIVLRVFKYLFCSIVVITSLQLAKRRRRAEVAEVDAEGKVVQKRDRLDSRFDNMILVVWLVYALYGIALVILSGMYIGFTLMKVLFVLSYLPVFYKLFLYRGMDGVFRKEFDAALGRGTQ